MATSMSSPIDIEQGIPRRSSGASSYLKQETRRCSDEESSSSESSKVEIVVDSVVTEMGRKSSSSSSSSSSSCVYESSAEEDVDPESGGVAVEVAALETKVSVHSAKVERDCRICYLSLDGSNPDSGLPIELGCSCKEDLGAAHKHCAEAWFKIRGNKTCEICGSTAQNVVGVNDVELMDQWNESNGTAATTGGPPQPSEIRHFWQGHRFLNFLLACMVFAFVISWLFHFNVPS